MSTTICTGSAYTVLLYTFEEGDGNTVTDLSGNKNVGKLMGTKWDDGNLREVSRLVEMVQETL